MFVETHDDGYTRLYIDEPLPEDFPARLLTELYALSRPVGAGALGAKANRSKSVSEIVAAGLAASRVDMAGRTHPNGIHYFDYVAGHRLKVDFHPNGIRDAQGEVSKNRGGLPAVVSRDFDMMYGRGSLEAAVKLALMR